MESQEFWAQIFSVMAKLTANLQKNKVETLLCFGRYEVEL